MVRAQTISPDKTWGIVTLVLVDNDGMVSANQAYFGKSTVTDVISCAYEPIPGEDNQYAGEVIVNVERACEEGPGHNGIESELALYIAHGCQHLAGREDDTPDKKAQMRATENEWLAAAEKLKLLDALMAGE